MRYELYKQISWEDDSIIFYVVECHNLKTLLTYIENYPLNSNENYLIIDNDSPNPINYKQLNLSSPPTENEHYKIIYECKLAKEHFRQMKEDDYDDCYLNYEILKLLCDCILATAEFQTAVYFEKIQCKKQKQGLNKLVESFIFRFNYELRIKHYELISLAPIEHFVGRFATTNTSATNFLLNKWNTA